MMLGSKPAIASTGLIGASVTILAAVAQIAGYAMSPDDQAALADLLNNGFILVTGLVTLVSGVVAFWGRFMATKQISGIVTSPANKAGAEDQR